MSQAETNSKKIFVVYLVDGRENFAILVDELFPLREYNPIIKAAFELHSGAEEGHGLDTLIEMYKSKLRDKYMKLIRIPAKMNVKEAN